MAKRIAGICYVTVDGTQLELKSDTGLEVQMSETVKTAIMSSNGATYYQEVPTEQYISGEFVVPKDFPFDKLETGDDMTITAELANGVVYTLSGAFVADGLTFSATGGTVTLKFVGNKAVKS